MAAQEKGASMKVVIDRVPPERWSFAVDRIADYQKYHMSGRKPGLRNCVIYGQAAPMAVYHTAGGDIVARGELS